MQVDSLHYGLHLGQCSVAAYAPDQVCDRDSDGRDMDSRVAGSAVLTRVCGDVPGAVGAG